MAQDNTEPVVHGLFAYGEPTLCGNRKEDEMATTFVVNLTCEDCVEAMRQRIKNEKEAKG